MTKISNNPKPKINYGSVTLELVSNSLEKVIFRTALSLAKQLNVDIKVSGGWVRDALLIKINRKGISPSRDIDFVLSEDKCTEFANLLSNKLGKTSSIYEIKSNPEKSKHLSTKTFHFKGYSIDINHYRVETYEVGTRIPIVKPGSALNDALRRDFTCNALSLNLQKNRVEDLSDRGIADLLLNHCIRTPNDPRCTFHQDPLRILRAVRFAVKLSYDLHKDIFEAGSNDEIIEYFKQTISGDRVHQELQKLVKQGSLKRWTLLFLLNLSSAFRGSYSVNLENTLIDIPHVVPNSSLLLNWFYKNNHMPKLQWHLDTKALNIALYHNAEFLVEPITKLNEKSRVAFLCLILLGNTLKKDDFNNFGKDLSTVLNNIRIPKEAKYIFSQTVLLLACIHSDSNKIIALNNTTPVWINKITKPSSVVLCILIIALNENINQQNLKDEDIASNLAINDSDLKTFTRPNSLFNMLDINQLSNDVGREIIEDDKIVNCPENDQITPILNSFKKSSSPTISALSEYFLSFLTFNENFRVPIECVNVGKVFGVSQKLISQVIRILHCASWSCHLNNVELDMPKLIREVQEINLTDI